MIIDSFIIEGISNIGHVRLDVGEMNALIAPNGYGKSNVLRAISFGLYFLNANEETKRQMLSSRYLPINIAMQGCKFHFEIHGRIERDGRTNIVQYGYECQWAEGIVPGYSLSEWLRIKAEDEQRFRQLINRKNGYYALIVPSATGRCNKPYPTTPQQLALPLIAGGSLYLSDLAKQICDIKIPNLETLDNPESYFSVDGGKGISLLGGMTLSEYIYRLKETDADNFSILSDGIRQLIPGVVSFEPDEITLSDGRSKVYDIRVQEEFNSQPTSIRLLSSGSKRMIFLFTLCMAAQKQNIPMIMVEEPENSVHPRLMENLLLTLQTYASNTKILMTSHSPYLMRYMQPDQMYFGLPKHDGLAHFAKVNPSKLKYLYKYAGDMELTFGEFMFDFMLDMEADDEKLATFFKQ
ncbi:AAA family ATPase [Bacteroides zoogleoformans]|nr:ATP-binding protein [Bacteroides zoogleoformans]